MPPEELAKLIGRRKALQVIGMAMVAVACGPAETATDDGGQDPESGSVRAGAGSGETSGASSSTSEPGRPGSTSTTDPIADAAAPEFDSGSALETVSVRSSMMPADMVEQLAAVYGGVWLGSWIDSNGAEGTIDANVGFNAVDATLDIAVAATGTILGSNGLAPTSVSVPLGGDFFEFEEREPFGYMYVSNRGDEQEVIALHDPPGAPDIETLMIELSYGPDGSAVATYQAFRGDGSVVTGSIVLAQGQNRPPTPSL